MTSNKKIPRQQPRSASPTTNKKRVTKTTAPAKSKSKAKAKAKFKATSANVRTTSRATRKSSTAGVSTVLGVLARYGVLRSTLAMAGVLLIVFAEPAGVVPVYSGWPFVPTVLLPVLAPLIFMLLLLDALMGRVLMSDMHGAERARRRNAVTVNLLLAVGLLLRWVPYYLALGK